MPVKAWAFPESSLPQPLAIKIKPASSTLNPRRAPTVNLCPGFYCQPLYSKDLLEMEGETLFFGYSWISRWLLLPQPLLQPQGMKALSLQSSMAKPQSANSDMNEECHTHQWAGPRLICSPKPQSQGLGTKEKEFLACSYFSTGPGVALWNWPLIWDLPTTPDLV